ncbi:L domain-like protein [Marasmius fiardii PR-910]|nr:L domain-like protein [Marasmius fiardii PR-910]
MSRIPGPSSTRSPAKPTTPSTPTRPAYASRLGATTPVRPRTKSSNAQPSPQKTIAKDDNPVPSGGSTLSIREAIALKRKEAKEAQVAQARSGGDALGNLSSLEDALPDAPTSVQNDEDEFGRWSVRETIERGRSSGTVNLSSRSLPCLPSGLFEIHLHVTPDRLKSVPNEPPLPPADPSVKTGRISKRDNAPGWLDGQDLQTLKAWNNDIAEIQHEISLFGSLKVIDLHQNKLTSLPQAFGDLTALTTLDLSHNNLSSLPTNLFSLPELTTFNISHNQLNDLPFNAPFASGRKSETTSGGFFTPVIVRATTPLPRLVTLDVSHNRLLSRNIDLNIPAAIQKINLSHNPLGAEASDKLIAKLGTLINLKELRLENADIGDDAFQPDLTPASSFARLALLDVGETKVTEQAVRDAFSGLKREASFDLTTENPPEGVVRVLVGKKVIREAWELEMERKSKSRGNRTFDSGLEWGSASSSLGKPQATQVPKVIEKESWEIEAEQGLLTEGAKRRTRAQAGAASSNSTSTSSAKGAPKEVLKEAWEVEAEQGLLTEGGRRRARAAAAVAAPTGAHEKISGHGATSRAASLANPQYYTDSARTLTLPASAPPMKSSGHARAFSMGVSSTSPLLPRASSSDLTVPAATVPLVEISSQSFAHSLRVLNLANRRMDRCFTIPISTSRVPALLPNVEELDLEGCGFSDFVSVSVTNSDVDSPSTTPQRTSEPIIPLLTALFPRLQTLNLSYNAISSSVLTMEALKDLILETPHRKGLRHLRLRGNHINDLDGFQGVADLFRGNRNVPGWKLEELDLRDNNIGKLPSEMGLLPLDVFLVDGNTCVLSFTFGYPCVLYSYERFIPVSACRQDGFGREKVQEDC